MPTFWYFLLLFLSTCKCERRSRCLLNDKNKMFWRTADAPVTNVSCSWRLAIAGIESKAGDGEVYLAFVHWTTIQKKLKKTNVPEQMKFLTLLEQNKKATVVFLAEVSAPSPPPPPHFLYEMPSKRVRKP